MSNISVNIPVLLMVGIPQSFLTVLAINLFARIEVNAIKYIILSLICGTATYLIRFLPIALGVNTVLILLVLNISFLIAYKTQLSKVINTIVSTVVAFLMIAFSEVVNMLILTAMFGQTGAVEMLDSSSAWTQGLSSAPSDIYFAVFIYAGYQIMKIIEKRKERNGDTGEKTGK